MSDNNELTPREKRLLIAENARKAGLNNPKTSEIKNREDFRKYFVKIKRKLNLNADLEEVIWLHLKAKGFNEKDLFENGIKDFGYNL